jgi:hypothetical protein
VLEVVAAHHSSLWHREITEQNIKIVGRCDLFEILSYEQNNVKNYIKHTKNYKCHTKRKLYDKVSINANTRVV